MGCIQSTCAPCLKGVDILDALSLIQNHSVELGLRVQQWATTRQLPVRFRVSAGMLLDPLLGCSVSQGDTEMKTVLD